MAGLELECVKRLVRYPAWVQQGGRCYGGLQRLRLQKLAMKQGALNSTLFKFAVLYYSCVNNLHLGI